MDASTIARLARDEAELVRQYNGFRARLGDATVTDNEIDRILHEERSSAAVEAAWRASKAIARYTGEDGRSAPVAERLRALVRLRNDAARQIGFDNAYRAHLELGEMEQDWLYSTLDLLERETRPLFEAWKRGLDRELAQRFGVAVSELRPWHYRDRFFQLPPPEGDHAELDPVLEGKDIVALAIRSFDDLGFDIRPIVERSDLFPGDPETSRKCQHAFCLSVDAPRDVRVLCNITTDQRWMGTTLHEFGHGIYGSSLDPALPFVLRDDPHTLCNEAIALLMERHLLDAGWLERVLGLDAGAARDVRRQRPPPPRDPPPGVHALGAGDVPLRARALREPRSRRPRRPVVGPGRALPAGAPAERPIIATTTGRPRSTSWATRRTTRTT